MQIILVRRKLMWLTSTYAQVAVIFGILVASPRYFSGKIHLGQMFQIIDAYNHVQQGFSFIIDSFTLLAQWRAVVNRLNNFLVCMELVRTEPALLPQYKVRLPQTAEFAVEHLHVLRPDGYELIKDLHLRFRTGQRLLVTGPSGCGKSTLLRTLAGLWPYAGGHMALPNKEKVMFVPQKSYMPLNKLRAVLFYPAAAKAADEARIKEALISCQLPYLTDKLDVTADWGQTLSLGEQQRVAFVRTLLHQPEWLFLDEATSALDETTESIIYELISRRLVSTAIVSVGHRSSLSHYHKDRLELDGQGRWRLSRIQG